MTKALNDGRTDGNAKIRTILFSSLFPSTARPGHGIFVETRLQQLLRSGEVETRVVAPVPWFPSRNSRYGRWAEHAATPLFERRGSVEVSHPRYPLVPKVSMSSAPLSMAIGAYTTVKTLLRQQDFDLFDAHYYYPDGAAAALLARWFNKPFVVTGRGTDLNVIPKFAVPCGWIRWTERRAACSILVSEALKQRLVALGGNPSRMQVVRNGVDLELFRPLPYDECRRALELPERRWLLSVGNLVPEKRHDIAIAALRHVPSDVGLVLVGGGKELSRLERLAAALDVADRVLFAGRRPQHELPYWYGAAELLLLCSAREGCPNVLLESLACGTPVVATAVGGVPEIVKSTAVGEVVQDDNPENIGALLRQRLSGPRNRSEVRAYAAQFGWAQATSAQVRLFREIASNNPNHDVPALEDV